MLTAEQKVKNCMEAVGLPYRYYQFKEGEGVPPPFLVYYFPSTDNFKSDNKVSTKINTIVVEYYYDQRDESEQLKIEEKFNENDFTWEKTEETYIEKEYIFVVYYSIAVL